MEKKSYYEKLDKTSFGSIRKGFSEGLVEAGREDENVVALTADLTGSLKIDLFKEEFENRFFQFGICEQNMMAAAAGMTIIGKVPFVASYAAFNPGRNWDQLRVSVCYQNSNVKIVGGHAGLTTGPDGATHQALEDIAITSVLPNLKVVVPCDENEARQATLKIAEDDFPCYLRLTREKSLNITEENDAFEIGQAKVLEEGRDVTIIACGVCVQFALEASNFLKKQGINATVINMHTIKPLDVKTIEKFAKKTRAIVTVEEHQKIGGLGSRVAEFLAENVLVPLEIIGVDDKFGESGQGYEVLDKYGISAENIVQKVQKVIKRKNNL